MTPLITCGTVEAGIRVIRLARPEARNALTLGMMRQLDSILDDIAADDGCHVVVLAADGTAFCAGLDLKIAFFGDEAPEGVADSVALQELFAGTILKLHRLPQPVIAAVQGAAVGAGFGLALAADVRVAAASAAFHVGAVKIGLSAGECGISYHLPRLVGAGRAFEIMLTGRPVSAAEAREMGLVSRVVIDGAVFGQALAIAHGIAAHASYSIRETKRVMWANLEATGCEAAMELENRIQVAGLMTADFREGARAFAEKRPPRFMGTVRGNGA
ncbi:enoyl-CoA hydratase/isomerase family protein [Nitrospirillum iridis]|uniref:Enoyl-CoA hydratase n=1 Tax=Nitrospirillum iridis TaxID=765888 RepID=A0A7X0B066_9PROT|nr:enoyl-CoA hydratase-related protein [Nitrospirillum iridis]MBB6253328.1 enoyl-CoA hydratase [Nitrospirillum iridis]